MFICEYVGIVVINYAAKYVIQKHMYVRGEVSVLCGVSDSAGTLYDDNGEFKTVISYG